MNLSKQRKLKHELKKTFFEGFDNQDGDMAGNGDDDHLKDKDEIRKKKEEDQKDKSFSKDFIFGLMKLPLDLIVRTKDLAREPFHQYSSFSKYILHIFLLICIHMFIYWYLPSAQNISYPLSNSPTIGFYVSI